jgi:uncharacterized protein (DUF3084 family)
MTDVEGGQGMKPTDESAELDAAIGDNFRRIYDQVLYKSLKEYVPLIQRRVQECEADRAARLEQIETLTKMLEESEADRAARLEQIETLTKMLEESEADRAARLEQIETLTKMLEESEADRVARLDVINRLTAELNNVNSRNTGVFQRKDNSTDKND